MRTLAYLGISLFLSGCAQLHDPSSGADSDADQEARKSDRENREKVEAGPGAGKPMTALIETPAAPVPEASRQAGTSDPEGKTAQPEEPEDFWSYYLPRLKLDAPDHNQVQAFIRFYRTHDTYLDRVFNRGKPFLPHILERLEERDMPPDLALLPVVESAFQPFAYSSGRAAGIWQFIPGTGRHFNLKQNWWYDGRRDILASTDAAVEYLHRLNERFDSWLLALAAYNAGPGNVSRAIRQNERLGRPTDFWSLNLPRETRSYVPKLLALSHVLRNTEEYGIELPELPMEKGFQVVNLEKPLDLAKAAELSGSDIETLYRLNPGLNRWATPPEGPGRLLLPKGTKERFEEGLAELDSSERVQWARHKIKRGEALSTIASRYNTTVSVLKDVNDLRGTRITAGDHLLIPTSSASDREYALSKSQRLAAIRGSGPSDRSKVVHRVQPGDSLWAISRRFGVQVGKLAKWNGMAPGDTLRPGQELAVWVDGGGNGSERSSKLRYRVRSGDSLWSIARKFNVTVDRLRNWNDLGQQQILQPGEGLTIYVDPTRLAEHQG
ncbi:hypothetical protein AN478_12780 [Thiohalorhabdus denitrificans]|uniref:Membrane-bound lytic murein transglycosylase D n=1 Tax=Thiohalorhabdus denitrificans TaxID=381306 RepID=A0A0P9GGK3_9GAMM|nr:LysM peptidoglycan-binding domain-containing protein [Thiohalorhabdus denitrificans]KPV39153.1 hypothetical protein AN478_12780 [Thiohalorhabdus denitrificans]SCX76242.1 membrane-bound lytic murein transglycosylase D [Thiohalorhabdus denitrificans]